MAGTVHLPKLNLPSLPGLSTDDESHFDLFEEMAIAERDELRSRLLKISIGFVLAFIVGLLLTRPLRDFVQDHIDSQRYEHVHQVEPIAGYFRTGLSIAIAFSLLMIYYEVIAFVSPVLTRKEKRFAYGSLLFVVITFLIGAALAFLVMTPRWLEFLANLSSDCIGCHSPNAFSIASYYLQYSLAMGIAFELIIIMVLLSCLGIISPKRMAVSRHYLVVVVLVYAAIITRSTAPADMLLVAAGTYLLYKIGIVFARIADRGKNQQSKLYDDDTPALAG